MKPFAAKHNDDTYLNNIHITERDVLEAVNNINVKKLLVPTKFHLEFLKKSRKKSVIRF